MVEKGGSGEARGADCFLVPPQLKPAVVFSVGGS